mmetsp:Transcript_6907/g.14212  ORF Transcript_6907/g.14212 Transcript_6907/m.14212 type:complete len:93 (+) Transcript_6907:46-324(+)
MAIPASAKEVGRVDYQFCHALVKYWECIMTMRSITVRDSQFSIQFAVFDAGFAMQALGLCCEVLIGTWIRQWRSLHRRKKLVEWIISFAMHL